MMMNLTNDSNSLMNEYGIILNSAVALRAKPDDRSEMVSQLLLGEKIICGEKENSFRKISNFMDNYTGWIDEKAITFISEKEYNELNKQSSYYVVIPLAEAFDLNSKCVVRIPGGSCLPNCDSIGRFGLHDRKFQVHRDYILPENELRKEGLLQTAVSFINAPYMWGGKTAMGIDCSGFTQIIYTIHGYKLPRDSKDQIALGNRVSLEEADSGDLAFFHDEKGNIIHVGMLLDKNRIIHSSGRVRVDKIDEKGIYSDEYQKYTHKLHMIKRYEWSNDIDKQLNLWR